MKFWKIFEFFLNNFAILRNFEIFWVYDIGYAIYTEYYMSKSVSHAASTREPYTTPRATGPRGDIGRGLIQACDTDFDM